MRLRADVQVMTKLLTQTESYSAAVGCVDLDRNVSVGLGLSGQHCTRPLPWIIDITHADLCGIYNLSA